MSALRYLDETEVLTALGPAAAVGAVEAALRGGLDPAAGVPRSIIGVAAGDLLLMPAETAAHVGVKVVAVAPRNAERGLPRINGVYLLFDAETLRPRALLDGVALTNRRTAAVSVAAVHPWLGLQEDPLRLVVFGAGPQGHAHAETVAAVQPVATVDLVVRQPDRVRPPERGRVLAAGSPEVAKALRAADVVVCATTAREPLFDSTLLGDHAVVMAVGSHEPEAREVDGAFCRRATVVVEDVATARREGGDVIQALAEGALAEEDLVPMRDVVRGERSPAPGPVLFKGSGMSWQDLVVAEAVLDAVDGREPAGVGA